MFSRCRLWTAGLVAFLLGVPLTQKAFGFGIAWAAVDLGWSIADGSSGDS